MSRSRRKLDTSPIEYEDVIDSPALKGMVSFLEVPPGQLPRLDFTTPETGIPAAGATVAIAPGIDTPQSGIAETGPLQTGIPVSGVPGATIPETIYPPVLSRPLTRIRRATLAQDGHSFGEQALYEALWQHAHPHAADTRIITIGYRRMSELARLTVNNCKANIQALVQKLAVEEVASFTHSHGRTDLMYSCAAILERRRQHGLTHYIKSRGVAFVDPDTGEPLIPSVRHKSGIPCSALPGPGSQRDGN
jgi:hypothetical protein